MRGLSNLLLWVDDMLVATEDIDEHLETVKTVINRCNYFRIRLNLDKT